jgi:hypothetical protein
VAARRVRGRVGGVKIEANRMSKEFARGAITVIQYVDPRLSKAESDELWKLQAAALREFADMMEAADLLVDAGAIDVTPGAA